LSLYPDLKIYIHLFSDALINVVGNERLVTGVNGTAGIFATYPTVGISTVTYLYIFSGAGTGGTRGATGPPIFGRPVNPIPTMGGRFWPPFTSGSPNVFHLPASLILGKLI
jgi:hypothetical protein